MSNFSTATILFVDDDQAMREVVALILNEEGYDVSTAADGLDALAQMRSLTPDLIISDLHMPRMSGFEPAIFSISSVTGAIKSSKFGQVLRKCGKIPQ